MYPEKIKLEFAKINPNKFIEFKYQGTKSQRNSDGKMATMGPTVFIPEQYDIVLDGEVHTIQHIISHRDGKPVLERIKFCEADFWIISLNPKDARDLKKIHFLLNHPLNGDSPYREETDTVLFKVHNTEVLESEEFDEEDKNRVRLNKIDAMSESLLRDVCRIYKAIGEDVESMNTKQLKLRVQKLTRGSKGEEFFKRLDSKDMQIDIDIAKAFDFNILIVVNKKVCWGGVIDSTNEGYAITDVTKGKKPSESMKSFISAGSKEAVTVYEKIKSDLKLI